MFSVVLFYLSDESVVGPAVGSQVKVGQLVSLFSVMGLVRASPGQTAFRGAASAGAVVPVVRASAVGLGDLDGLQWLCGLMVVDSGVFARALHVHLASRTGEAA